MPAPHRPAMTCRNKAQHTDLLKHRVSSCLVTCRTRENVVRRLKLLSPPPGSPQYLSGLQVHGLAALRIRLNLERDALTVTQAAHSAHLDRRSSNDHVPCRRYTRAQ